LLLNDFWDHEWILCSFGVFVRTPELKKYPIASLLVDESSAIKNPRTNICKLITKFSRSIRIRGILTGTLRPEDDQEIYPQINIPFKNFMDQKDFWSWRRKYFKSVGYDWIASKKTKQIIKENLQRVSFIKERKDVELGTDPIHEVRKGQLYTKARVVYNHIAKDWEWNGHETKYAT
jgi:hypothetical protein